MLDPVAIRPIFFVATAIAERRVIGSSHILPEHASSWVIARESAKNIESKSANSAFLASS